MKIAGIVVGLLLLFAFAQEESLEEQIVRANHFGVALMEQLRFQDAADQFAGIHKLKPNLAFAYVNEGIARYNLQDHDGALDKFQKALELDPGSIQAHYMRALVLRSRDEIDEAIKEFEWVRERDPEDPSTLYYLGLLYARKPDYDRAIASFRRVLESEPYNVSAHYNLAIALMRSGKQDEGQRQMSEFRRLQQLFGKQSQGVQYLEQGRYSAVVEDLPAEILLRASESPVEVRFEDVTARAGLPVVVAEQDDAVNRLLAGSPQPLIEKPLTGIFSGGAALLDYNSDGALDLYVTQYVSSGPGRNKLYRNNGKGKFEAVSSDVLAGPGPSSGCLAADFDNDGFPDLALLTRNGARLLHNDKGEKFTDVTASARLRDSGWSVGGAFVDYDHDGDLDLLVLSLGVASGLAGSEPANPRSSSLWRNNGDGMFTDVFAETRMTFDQAPSSVAFADFNNSRDVDFLVAGINTDPLLFSNLRDGTFKKIPLPDSGGRKVTWSLQVLDFNQDGWMDVWLGKGDSSVLLKNEKGKLVSRVPDFPGPGARCAAVLDFDNDGDLDLMSGSPGGLRLLANRGHRFFDVSDETGISQFAFSANSIAAADIDGDGDLDVLASGPGGQLRLLENNGGNRNNWLSVRLDGTNSNKGGLQAKVEGRSGSWWQKLELNGGAGGLGQSQPVAHFGLGKRSKVELLRILWPGGVLQSEYDVANRQLLAIKELDRKGTSCPILYAWDGSQYKFVTDFLGGSAFGYLLAPGKYNFPDTDEYIRLDRGQLGLRDGRYSLTMNNQLEEVIMIDKAELVAVDHPARYEVFPNEKLLPGRPYDRFRLIFADNARPPRRATDSSGRDVLAAVSNIDRVYPDNFQNLPFKGYAETHSLTLDLGDLDGAPAVHLLMHAWIDYADSTSNLAAAQAGQRLVPPYLEVADGRGGWVTAVPRMGFPAGLPKTMTVDLTGKFQAADYRVRITTNMRIYWDQILVSVARQDVARRVIRLRPVSARLQWKGYPKPLSPDGRLPYLYDYNSAAQSEGWKSHRGGYTRYGDIGELVDRIDDHYVIMRHGDEIRLDFDPSRLPALPDGWVRGFLVYADGFGKDMDVNSARPDTIEPLPFHAMSAYPYPPGESFPDTASQRRWQQLYNTRRVYDEYARIPQK